MSNGWMMPFVFVITCGTGNFAGETGLSESWVRYGSIYNGGGAVVCVGAATSGTHTRFNNIIAGGIGHGFFVTDGTEAGLALVEAKFQLYRSYYPHNSSDVENFSRWNNLMGDPGLKIWTGSPLEFDATHPVGIPLGANRVPVLVHDETGEPVEGALVCLMKGEETWTRAITDASGYLEMPVDLVTEGDLWLTVSKMNYLTFMADIPVSQEDFWVASTGVEIDDDDIGGTSGNDDGELNPGETVDLMITAKNYGNSIIASDVWGTLFSHDNAIAQVLFSEQPFPDIFPGEEVQSQGSFRVSISPCAQDQDLMSLLLQFDTSQEMDTSLVSLAVMSGDADYQSHNFLISNNRLDPGETEQLAVSIGNVGHRNMSLVQGHLFTEDTLITFPDPDASFGTITMGGNSTNNGDPFQVTASPVTIPGYPVTLGMSLDGSDGFKDTVYFDIRVGLSVISDPTGPDDYGYYCFDNTDQGYDIAPDYEWIEVDPNHGGSGESLPLYDNWEGGDDSVIRQLPFTLRMYGVDYDTITICSNGWAALGNQVYYVNFRNYAIPGAHGPDAMMAAFWDDLVIGSGRVCWEYIAADGIAVVEWSGVRTRYNSYTETFQIILYDPAIYPTPTGDGMIKFQYMTVTNTTGDYADNHYATVGIEDHTQMDGLQVSYWNSYSPGAASLTANRAYLFTTSLVYGFGDFEGQVTDLENGLSLQNALVSVDGGEYQDYTNSQGNFSISDLVVGQHEVVCSKDGYNDVETTIEIIQNQNTEQDFELPHPEFLLDVTGLQQNILQGDTTSVTFHLENQGNGELIYQIAYDVPSGASTPAIRRQDLFSNKKGPVRPSLGTDDPWDQLLLFDVNPSSPDNLIQGAAFAWGYFWVVGGGLGPTSENYLYQYDIQGNYVGRTEQPTNSPYGFRDLAFDGECLWGSDSRYLVAFNSAGAVIDSIEGVLSPNRALAYDPNEDVFYTGNITAPIAVVDRQGNEVYRYADHDLIIYGLAWFKHDPDGYPLYLFCQEGNDTRLAVNKLDPSTGDIQFVTELQGSTGDLAGGAAITGGWNSSVWAFVGQIMGVSYDQIGVWELGPNTSWISVLPGSGQVGAGGGQTFRAIFDAREMPGGDYHLNMVFHHDAVTSPDTIPVDLSVTPVVVEPEENITPFEYSLGQNYPNPFNPVTTIPYSLRETGNVKLVVFNILGQRVATLVEGRQEAGPHRALLDAGRLASGVYFYRLEAGEFNKTMKMVILK